MVPTGDCRSQSRENSHLGHKAVQRDAWLDFCRSSRKALSVTACLLVLWFFRSTKNQLKSRGCFQLWRSLRWTGGRFYVAAPEALKGQALATKRTRTPFSSCYVSDVRSKSGLLQRGPHDRGLLRWRVKPGDVLVILSVQRSSEPRKLNATLRWRVALMLLKSSPA